MYVWDKKALYRCIKLSPLKKKKNFKENKGIWYSTDVCK